MKFEVKFTSARPYLAAFTILRRGNLIAMVLRKNTGWMDGHYGLPAGKIEWGETLLGGAVRETLEEAGVVVQPPNIKLVHTAHRHGEDKELFMDWVDLYFEAATWEGEPHNAEPEKSEALEWLDLNKMPDNIVPSQRDALIAVAEGLNYSEFGWPKRSEYIDRSPQ